MSEPHVYLIKDNDDLLCQCTCERADITFPPQMDCPWCGCGWIFSCIACRRAFTFARAVEVRESWEDLARQDLENFWHAPPADQAVADWVAAMQELHADVEVGQQYVCFDGLFIPTNATGISFRGWHSEHHLNFVPQVRACEDYFVIENILVNREYWLENALPRDGAS